MVAKWFQRWLTYKLTMSRLLFLRGTAEAATGLQFRRCWDGSMAVRDNRTRSLNGAALGLDSAEVTLMSLGLCALGGIWGDTDNTGEVEAEWEALGVLGSEVGYAIGGLGMAGVSFKRETWVEKERILEIGFTLCANGAGG
jgi:hypothetical protein